MTQVRATGAANPLTELAAIVSVLPLVAPEANDSDPDAGVRVNEDAVRVAVTVVEAVTAMEEFAVVPVPEIVAVRTPLVPAVVVILTVTFAVPPDVRSTEAGNTEQEPAAVPAPLRFAAAQVRATLPTKLFVEATVTVLETVPPETRVPEVGRAAGEAVRVKAEAVRLTTMVAEVTVLVPLVPVTTM